MKNNTSFSHFSIYTSNLNFRLGNVKENYPTIKNFDLTHCVVVVSRVGFLRNHIYLWFNIGQLSKGRKYSQRFCAKYNLNGR